MCNEAVCNKLCMMLFVPDHLWMKETRNEIMRAISNAFHCIPDHFKTQEMCIKAVEIDPSFLQLIPEQFQMQEICDKAVKNDSSSLQFVPDWFVTREQVDMWYDDNEYCDGDDDDDDDEDSFFKWYDGYKKRKVQKASIKKESMPITWHQSRWLDWCMSEDEKSDAEKLWQ